MRLDPTMVRRQIENLLISCPELADDEVLRADMIEGETDAYKFLGEVEERRVEAESVAHELANRISRLDERSQRYERRAQAMRGLMFKIMEAANIKKIEMPAATLSIRSGTQKVIITDVDCIPDRLCRVVSEPDKAAIKSELMTGTHVPGAHLSNAEPTLSIRTK